MPPKQRLGLIPKEEEDMSDDDELFRGDDDDSSTVNGGTAEPEERDSKGGLLRSRALKKPRSTNYSARQLFEMLEIGSIDLDPVWQRGVVWPEKKQSAIIDSIINHYYVPPVLFSMRTNEDGDTCSVCIDGKQRLSSIFNFMSNVIPLRPAGTKQKIWFHENREEKQYPALSTKMRRAFEMEQIAVIEYEDLLDSQEREMFSRVQMGVPLSPAEKLGAVKGPWGDYFRELVKRFFDEKDANLQHIAKLDRGKDFQLMAQICLYVIHYAQDRYTPLSGIIATFLKDLGNTLPEQSFRETIRKTMSKFVLLANDEEYNACVLPKGKLKKYLAPIEFCYVALAIWRFPGATHAQLSELINNMTTFIRGSVKDVMFNNNVNALLRDWLNAQTIPGCRIQGPSSTRKRAVPMDDDDDDYRPSPARQAPRRAIAAPAPAPAAAPAPEPAMQHAVQQMMSLQAPAANYGLPMQNYGFAYQQ